MHRKNTLFHFKVHQKVLGERKQKFTPTQKNICSKHFWRTILLIQIFHVHSASSFKIVATMNSKCRIKRKTNKTRKKSTFVLFSILFVHFLRNVWKYKFLYYILQFDYNYFYSLTNIIDKYYEKLTTMTTIYSYW